MNIPVRIGMDTSKGRLVVMRDPQIVRKFPKRR